MIHLFKISVSFLILVVAISCSVPTAKTVPTAALANDFQKQELLHIFFLLSKISDKQKRIEKISELFLGARYQLDPLGEGDRDSFDQDPIFRLDAFDCTTYLETVMALSLSNNEAEFTNNLIKIRYKNSEISFVNRNHFPELDLMPNNISNGILQDATAVFGKDLMLTEKKEIDKKVWFQNLRINRISNNTVNYMGREKLLKELQSMGANFQKQSAEISFIPFEKFILKTDSGYSVNKSLLSKIKSGSFFNLVQVYDKKDVFEGTNLLVWHQGIFIRTNKGLIIRHAFPNGEQSVSEISATDYILSQFLKQKVNKRSTAGLNFFQLK